jgi:hypothetical protein
MINSAGIRSFTTLVPRRQSNFEKSSSGSIVATSSNPASSLFPLIDKKPAFGHITPTALLKTGAKNVLLYGFLGINVEMAKSLNDSKAFEESNEGIVPNASTI